MRFTIALAVLLVTTSAFAQDRAPDPTPTETPAPAASPAPPVAQPLPSKFYLELDQADLALIGQAINELPKRVADPLITRINAQINVEAQPAIKEKVEKVEKAKKGRK